MLTTLKNIFNSMYLLVYGDEYVFQNKRVEKSLEAFLKQVPVGAGEDWLYNFVLFQFAYYDGMKTRFDRIYVNWIFGKKALARWKNRTEAELYYANKFKLRLGVRKENAVRLPAQTYLEMERRRYTDLNQRLLNCDSLALFEECPFCQSCGLYSACSKHDAYVRAV